jgi:alpha-1,2-mannosyltransferase
VVVTAIFRTNTGWMYDLNVYRMGGSILLKGTDLYARTTPHPYTYPPFSALVFVGLTLLPPTVMAVLWTSLSIAGLMITTWLILGWIGISEDRRRIAWTAVVFLLAVWLDPIADTLLSGQVNVILMAIVLADLSLPDQNGLKGIGVGLAAGIKLLPVFFVLYLVVTRRLGAAARAVAAFLATVVIGFILAPADSVAFWRGTFLDSTRVGDPQNPRSESLQSVIVRWTHTTSGIRPLWLAAELLVAFGILVLARWAYRRGDELLGICTAAAGTLLLSPITWRHHWVWVLPMLIWLVHQARTTNRRWLWVVAALIAADFYVRPYGGIVVAPVADLHLDLGQLILSSTHPVSVALFLMSATVVLSRSLDSSPTKHRRLHSEPGASSGRR